MSKVLLERKGRELDIARRREVGERERKGYREEKEVVFDLGQGGCGGFC